MTKVKVLNLYAGIGGNRKQWDDTKVEVTAVEINPAIAKIYRQLFPGDKVVVGDAHQYLLNHYMEFDFIWASPPCPTHSRLEYTRFVKGEVRYPDMSLYQEIIFLTWVFKGSWVVENVISYYTPLIKPKLIGRHYYWSNFDILPMKIHINDDIANASFKILSEHHGFDLSEFDLSGFDEYKKRLLLRNCVHPKQGLHIFNCAFKNKQVMINDF